MRLYTGPPESDVRFWTGVVVHRVCFLQTILPYDIMEQLDA